MKAKPLARRRQAGTIAWILLVLASMVLIAYGLAQTMFFIWAPEPAMLERARVGGLFITAGCALSLAAAAWSHLRQHCLDIYLCGAARGSRWLGDAG